jgi:S1-C subfamily serine protease
MSRRAAAAAGLAITSALGGCGGAAAPTAPVAPALLAVTVTEPSGATSIATAFAAGDGRAVTVAHAIAGRAVLVAPPGGRARRARVVATDARLDLAVLEVPGLKAPALRVTRPHAGEGTSVLVMRGGRSQSLRATVRRVITARVRDAPGAAVRVRPALELDAAVMQGDSGAPVLDGEGRVVGMVFAQLSDREDRSYALDGRAVRSGAR